MSEYKISISVGGGNVQRIVQAFTLADAIGQVMRDETLHGLLCDGEAVTITVAALTASRGT